MIGKAIFFGFLTMLVVGVTNSLRMYFTVNTILFNRVIWRSFLAGLGVGAAVYVSTQAFQVFYEFRNSRSGEENLYSSGGNDFMDQKLSPEDLEPGGEGSGEPAKMGTDAAPPQEPGPDQAAAGKPGETKGGSQDSEGEELDDDEAAEIADLISETIDEE